MLTVFCDGSIVGSHWAKKGNKDSPAYGWTGWVIKAQDGLHIHHSAESLGTDATMSANVAEYSAVKSSMRWLLVNGFRLDDLKIHSDSQLVMFQLSGKYNCHNERLKVFRDHILDLAKFFPSVAYHWIPREQNKEADFLSKAINPDHGFGGCVPPWEIVLANTKTGVAKP